MRTGRAESTTFEFVLVVMAAFGSPILGSVLSLVNGPPASGYVFTDNRMLGTMTYEILMLSLIALILYSRGWSLHDLKWEISFKQAGVGLALGGISLLIPTVLSYILGIIYIRPEDPQLIFDINNANIAIVLGMLIVNSLFEEIIVVGYVMEVLSTRYNWWIAINSSVTIRLLYHLYQGGMAAVSILPMGFLYSYYYSRKRNLWPLILAHTMHNVVCFLGFNYGA